MIIVLFFLISIPITLMMFLVGRRSRITLSFMLLGMLICLFTASFNGQLLKLVQNDYRYLTTNIAPISEEFIKFLAIQFYAAHFSRKRDDLLNVSMAVGIGFAIFENLIFAINKASTVSIAWAVSRSFAASLLHGVCTSMVGFGMSFIESKKFRVPGVFSLLVMAITYHAIFNTLIQSSYSYIGMAMPMLTYVPFIIYYIRKLKEENAAEKALEALDN